MNITNKNLSLKKTLGRQDCDSYRDKIVSNVMSFRATVDLLWFGKLSGTCEFQEVFANERKAGWVCYHILLLKRGNYCRFSRIFFICPMWTSLILWIWGFVARTFLQTSSLCTILPQAVGKLHASEIFVERLFFLCLIS